MSLTQFQFPGEARDFSPRVNFHCKLSYGVRTTTCAIACTNIFAVKDPKVHVTVWWIMETLQHPACTIGLGSASLSQLAFPGKQPKFPMAEILVGVS